MSDTANGSGTVKVDLKRLSLILGLVITIVGMVTGPLFYFQSKADAKEQRATDQKACEQRYESAKEDMKEMKEDVKEIKRILMRQERRRGTDE